jgi:AraC-like DNA-binding protein
VPGEHTTEVVLGIKHGLPLPASIAEFFMGSLFQALSRLGVPGAVAVHFAHAAPPALTQHEAFFRAPLCFDAPRHYAVFDTAALSQPLASADAALAKTLERHAAEMLERIPRGSAFADRLRQLLIELLPGGAPSLRACAQRLRMSERTVRRRLADDGHNYQSLLDELRHNLALHYLSIDDFDAERAAFLLGFTDASSFRRAFKRWTGRTLVVHRTQLAERAR